MKKECEIIKDLLPIYVDSLVSETTKEYVERHLENCTNCKEILENMQENNIEENKEISEEEQVEIKQIKKYKRKMLITKIIIITFIVILIAGASIFLIQYIPKKSIISKTYNTIQELKGANNFKMIVTQHYTDYKSGEKKTYISEYYYKDGKYKEITYSDDLAINSIYYWDVNSSSKVWINKNEKTINKIRNSYVGTKDEVFDIFGDINYYFENPLSIMGNNIRTDNYNGKDCYVIRFGTNELNYREIWIDKQTMIQVREVQEIDGFSNLDRLFTIQLNQTVDTEINMQDFHGYTNENDLSIKN